MDRKQNNPLISIVIPIYNVAAYLESCLASVVAQTYRPLEVILVDDCGTDNSMEIAETFVNSFTELKDLDFRTVHHDHNRGLSAARNTGTSVANGEYIIYLDSDDQFEPTLVKESYESLLLHDADFTICDFRSDEANASRSSHISYPAEVFHSREDFYEALANCQIGVSAWGKLFRKSYVERHGISFIEGIVNEDETWLFNMSVNAKRIALVKKPLYYYRYNETSIMSKMKLLKKLDSLSITIDEYLRIINTDKSLKERLSIYRLYMRLVVVYYENCTKGGIAYKTKEKYDSPYFSLYSKFVPKYYLLWNWSFVMPALLKKLYINSLVRIHG